MAETKTERKNPKNLAQKSRRGRPAKYQRFWQMLSEGHRKAATGDAGWKVKIAEFLENYARENLGNLRVVTGVTKLTSPEIGKTITRCKENKVSAFGIENTEKIRGKSADVTKSKSIGSNKSEWNNIERKMSISAGITTDSPATNISPISYLTVQNINASTADRQNSNKNIHESIILNSSASTNICTTVFGCEPIILNSSAGSRSKITEAALTNIINRLHGTNIGTEVNGTNIYTKVNGTKIGTEKNGTNICTTNNIVTSVVRREIKKKIVFTRNRVLDVSTVKPGFICSSFDEPRFRDVMIEKQGLKKDGPRCKKNGGLNRVLNESIKNGVFLMRNSKKSVSRKTGVVPKGVGRRIRKNKGGEVDNANSNSKINSGNNEASNDADLKSGKYDFMNSLLLRNRNDVYPQKKSEIKRVDRVGGENDLIGGENATCRFDISTAKRKKSLRRIIRRKSAGFAKKRGNHSVLVFESENSEEARTSNLELGRKRIGRNPEKIDNNPDRSANCLKESDCLLLDLTASESHSTLHNRSTDPNPRNDRKDVEKIKNNPESISRSDQSDRLPLDLTMSKSRTTRNNYDGSTKPNSLNVKDDPEKIDNNPDRISRSDQSDCLNRSDCLPLDLTLSKSRSTLNYDEGSPKPNSLNYTDDRKEPLDLSKAYSSKTANARTNEYES